MNYAPEELQYIRRSTEKDVEKLSPNLRQADIQELRAGLYASPHAALSDGLKNSTDCFTILSPSTGEPMAMFGASYQTEHRYSTVWLLGTDELLQHKRKFLRYSKRWIHRLLKVYGTIGNYVDERNTVHIRWLEWCGFMPQGCIKTKETRFTLYVKER